MTKKQIKTIVKILRKHEDGLSDGFGYYTPYQYADELDSKSATDRHLQVIASEILEALGNR